MPTPTCSVTIPFPRPITGSELIQAVTAVAEQNNNEFRSTHGFGDGDYYRIGQYSSSPYENLLVAPSSTDLDVRPPGSYDQVVVMDYSWGGFTHAVRYSDEDVIRSVRTFGDLLRLQVILIDEAEETTQPSIWPQSVTVCFDCERVITSTMWGSVCPIHGTDPLTKQIKVVPAPA